MTSEPDLELSQEVAPPASTAAVSAGLHALELALLENLRSLGRGELVLAESESAVTLPGDMAARLFEAQVASRLVDHAARHQRSGGKGYYTIASAGHESNAAVALALRPTDPALLHYRSGGFYLARATQVEGVRAVDDILRGMFASTKEPISGGRHKVFGRKELNIVPQTSTIASHLPRAVGLAVSLSQGAPDPVFGEDAVVVCSLGDASLNHSTAQGALNWAANLCHKGQRVPAMFVVEDNGIGISVATPQDWIEQSCKERWGIDYAVADGQDPASVYAVAGALAARMRETGRPAILQLKTVRFLGHAGSDVETAYRDAVDIRSDYIRDPLLGTAKVLIEQGTCSGEELVSWYMDERQLIFARAEELSSEPRLSSAHAVISALAPRRPEMVQTQASVLGEAKPGDATKTLSLAQTINDALERSMAASEEIIVFGEDVAVKGGVYGVTRGLHKRFGPKRVFDTILDEQSVFGTALGAGLNGFTPIPEIQYLAYVHNAADQLRGEAATLSFFSDGQYKNPMVVRIASFGYQKGFGGHFHNDNSVAVLRDIPGLVVALPSHPADAGSLLRTCIAAAQIDGTVSVFLEPIALYHTADLYEAGDELWLATPNGGVDADHIRIGTARTFGTGEDLTVLTWGNGTFMSLRVQHQVAKDLGAQIRIVDLRWLAPLPVEDILREASATGNVLIVDETRRSGGIGEALIAELVEGGFGGNISRVASEDSLIPLGDAADLVLLSESEVYDAVCRAVAK